MAKVARSTRYVYPFPVYEAHLSDNTVVRMSVYQPIRKPWAFDRFRHVLSKSGRREIVDGYLEHDAPGQPWLRLRDPLFSGVTVETKPKRRNNAALRKWAEIVLQQVDHQADDSALILTPEAVSDLRSAMDLAA